MAQYGFRTRVQINSIPIELAGAMADLHALTDAFVPHSRPVLTESSPSRAIVPNWIYIATRTMSCMPL